MVQAFIQGVISSTWRKTVYAVAGVVIGAIQVGYAAAESGQPVWLTVTSAATLSRCCKPGHILAETPVLEKLDNE